MGKEEAREHISSEIKRLCMLAHKHKLCFIAACDHEGDRMHTEANSHTLFTTNLATELIMKNPEITALIPHAIRTRELEMKKADPENDFQASTKKMDL